MPAEQSNPLPLTAGKLAGALLIKPFAVIGDLMKLGCFRSVNQEIPARFAEILCAQYGFVIERREGAMVLWRTPLHDGP